VLVGVGVVIVTGVAVREGIIIEVETVVEAAFGRGLLFVAELIESSCNSPFHEGYVFFKCHTLL
jgi:hypothetical protein